MRSGNIQHFCASESNVKSNSLVVGFMELKGAVDKTTLMALHTLGSAHMRMGDFDKSIELSQRALRGREKLFGKSHQDTLRTINNLAMAYYSIGDYSEASALYERALEAWAGQLGWKHTNTLMTCNGLAGVYFSSGEYERSIELYEVKRQRSCCSCSSNTD